MRILQRKTRAGFTGIWTATDRPENSPIKQLLDTANYNGIGPETITIHYGDGWKIEYRFDTTREEAIRRIQELIRWDTEPDRLAAPTSEIAEEMKVISDKLKGAFL